MFKIVDNKDKRICAAYRCNKKRGAHSKFCPKHHSRRQKEVNPEGYFYNLLKQNAKRRGKDFKLTRPEFAIFCAETGYLRRKGKNKNSASIDRIDLNKGYEISNIQVLTLRENSSKGVQEYSF